MLRFCFNIWKLLGSRTCWSSCRFFYLFEFINCMDCEIKQSVCMLKNRRYRQDVSKCETHQKWSFTHWHDIWMEPESHNSTNRPIPIKYSEMEQAVPAKWSRHEGAPGMAEGINMVCSKTEYCFVRLLCGNLVYGRCCWKRRNGVRRQLSLVTSQESNFCLKSWRTLSVAQNCTGGLRRTQICWSTF